MINKFYLPVLKTKQGEFDGLAILESEVKKSIVPLIEFTKLEFDNAVNTKPKTIEGHLTNICKRISAKWGSSNGFIDPYLIYDTLPGGETCFEYIYNKLVPNNVIPLPIVQLSTPDNLITNIREIISLYKIEEVGIRVFIPNIVSPNFLEDIRQLLENVRIKPENCHLILDLNSADFSNTDDFSDSIIDQLKTFPYLESWKSFTICGGSFPATNRIKVGVNEIPRGEWIFFNKLIQKQQRESFERPINFGDYGIVAPGHFEYDPVKMDRSANIRYTHNDIWYVIKGKSLKTTGHGQYFALAKEVSDSTYFLGETFCEGDAHLKKCSLRQTSTGNPTVWNKIGFNHHFSKVIADLSANYFAA